MSLHTNLRRKVAKPQNMRGALRTTSMYTTLQAEVIPLWAIVVSWLAAAVNHFVVYHMYMPSSPFVVVPTYA